MAAVVTAPEPSATTFWFSIKNNTASAISSSCTKTTSSIKSLAMLKVNSPTVLTDIPSAIEVDLKAVVTFPDFIDSYMEGILAVWTPTIFTFGFNAFAAVAIPAIIPPPPIGQRIVSTLLFICSKISSPIVPWPAITYLSLNGCKKVAPVSFWISTAFA